MILDNVIMGQFILMLSCIPSFESLCNVHNADILICFCITNSHTALNKCTWIESDVCNCNIY